MPRIRTIKPEFPQSESMGRVSREARLFYILLWTVADDSGRLRAHSRILASLLYPFDTDVFDLIEAWITELVDEECIVRYTHDNATYIQILNWLKHQKIDKPGVSKLPEFDDDSRILANPREPSTTDLGSRIEDLGPKIRGKTSRASRSMRLPDDFDLNPERRRFCESESKDPEREFAKFTDYWRSASGAKARKTDWDATWRNWCRSEFSARKSTNGKGTLSAVAVSIWERLLASEGADRSPEAHKALEAVGGWSAVRMRDAFTAEKLKVQFCHAYEGANEPSRHPL